VSGYVGGTSAADIARLRRMVAEPSTTTYSDVLLEDAITRHPVADPEDVYPDESGWIPSYDLALAAAEIWEEKAAALAANFDFEADGATFSKSQQTDHATAQARIWRSRRVAGNWTVMPEANSATRFGEPHIGNINNPYEYGL